MPFEVELLGTGRAPLYQRIARKSVHLYQLGLSLAVIALRLGVTDKTVAKAIRWLTAVTHNREQRDGLLESGVGLRCLS